jgi:hypothetical protein
MVIDLFKRPAFPGFVGLGRKVAATNKAAPNHSRRAFGIRDRRLVETRFSFSVKSRKAQRA